MPGAAAPRGRGRGPRPVRCCPARVNSTCPAQPLSEISSNDTSPWKRVTLLSLVLDQEIPAVAFHEAVARLRFFGI